MNADAFELLGARPVFGRWFSPTERASTPVALISEDSWRQRFAATRDLGTINLTIDGLSYQVVGVFARGLPPFAGWGDGERPISVSADIVVPDAGADPTSTRISALVMLRASRGANVEQLVDQGPRIASMLEARHGGTTRPISVRFSAFKAYGALESVGYEQAMLGAAAMIVLIACANVSALMLARAVSRRRDQALRLALGASRSHLVTDVVAEVTVIAIAGAIGGLVISDWSMRVLAAVTPPDLPWLGFRAPHWSPWVFAGLLLVVMVAIAIASIVPASFVSSVSPSEQLKNGAGTTTGRTSRAFHGLVVVEIAVSLVLIIGSSLVAKSADRVAGFNFGYEPRTVVSIRPQIRVADEQTVVRGNNRVQVGGHLPAVSVSSLDDIVARLRHVSGVRSAAWMTGGIGWHKEVMLADRAPTGGGRLYGVEKFFAGPGVFQTLGLRILEGRDLSEADRAGAGAVVLDQIAAQRLFRGENAIGRMVKFGVEQTPGPWLPVVGIVESVVHELPADPAVPVPPTAYALVPQMSSRISPQFIIRADSPSGAARAAAVVGDLLPPNTAYHTAPWLDRFDRNVSTRRFISGMFLVLSVASLALAVAGLFGVLSYAVTQRTREFATRSALGAPRAHVVGLVLHDGFVMALGGTALGGTVAMYAAFVLWKWLWGVYPIDAEALLISEGILLAVTAVAAVIPALRATRADPVEVMRAT